MSGSRHPPSDSRHPLPGSRTPPGWNRFKQYCFHYPSLGVALDISRMAFPRGYLEQMAGRMEHAFADMAELERGAIPNPD